MAAVNGPFTAAVKGGMGIPGMRERAELLGGVLHAAPEPGGGFTVTARLPAGQRTGPSGAAGSAEPAEPRGRQ